MTVAIPVVHVDVFTAARFGGNPAAVCRLPEPADARFMQELARELSLPATAFVTRRTGGFELRWFGPAGELTLCGHGTLASAHVLWEDGELSRDEPARFHTMSGMLVVRSRGAWREVDFAAEPPAAVPVPPGLLDALGVTPVFVGKNRLDYLVEVESEKIVRGVTPDFARLRDVPTRGVIVTARSSSAGYDFVSRFFAPSAGIDEDPATGSSHCCLGPFWASRLGTRELTAFQASTRGGVIRVRVEGDRVAVSGQAVTVLRGTLL